MFNLYQDGKLIWNTINTMARDWKNVEVFAGNTIHQPLKAHSVESLQINVANLLRVP